MQMSQSASARPSGARRRLVSLEELRGRFGISYSRQHLYRRMQEGTFPKAVKLSSSRFSRRMWMEDDILEWLDLRTAERDEVEHG